MTHATEHITDPSVFRLRVSSLPGCVLFAWDYPGSTLLTVRIQRSADGFPSDPEDAGAVVFEGSSGSFRDATVVAGQKYFYTVWARRAEACGQASGWTLWEHRRVRAGGGDRSRLQRLAARLRSAL